MIVGCLKLFASFAFLPCQQLNRRKLCHRDLNCRWTTSWRLLLCCLEASWWHSWQLDVHVNTSTILMLNTKPGLCLEDVEGWTVGFQVLCVTNFGFHDHRNEWRDVQGTSHRLHLDKLILRPAATRDLDGQLHANHAEMFEQRDFEVIDQSAKPKGQGTIH